MLHACLSVETDGEPRLRCPYGRPDDPASAVDKRVRLTTLAVGDAAPHSWCHLCTDSGVFDDGA